MIDCVFCKIVNKDIPAKIVFEDDDFLVFEDIKPKAPLHWLVIPKKHIPSLNELDDPALLIVARDIARQYGLVGPGYKVSINVGKGAGQQVDHVHMHLLSQPGVQGGQARKAGESCGSRTKTRTREQ